MEGFDFDRSTSAIVCFWDHASFSACIVLNEVTPKELALLIDQTVRNPQVSPGVSAGIFANMAFEVAEISLTNVPPAPNTGATLSRMHLPDNAPGGIGLVIVDQEKCELMIYGGTGWDEDYNIYQARIVRLEDVIARLPEPITKGMTTLEIQKLKNTMSKEMIEQARADAPIDEAQVKAQTPPATKVTRKRGK
jgi:hypothetical protein